jgi:hypothetical protein
VDESEAVSDPAVIDDETFVRLAVPLTVDDLEIEMVAVALLLLRLRDIDVVGTVGETERVVLERECDCEFVADDESDVEFEFVSTADTGSRTIASSEIQQSSLEAINGIFGLLRVVHLFVIMFRRKPFIRTSYVAAPISRK